MTVVANESRIKQVSYLGFVVLILFIVLFCAIPDWFDYLCVQVFVFADEVPEVLPNKLQG